MTDQTLYPIPEDLKKTAKITPEIYEKMYRESVENPEVFWSKLATEKITWQEPFKECLSWNYNSAKIEWFKGGKLNVSENCLDRHLAENADKIAIIWEGNEPGDVRRISYRELYESVCRFANVLKKHGVKKGDRVAIYMPMIPELAMAMLACARIGAIHSVIFGGFSSDAIHDRMEDAEATVLITADQGLRGAKTIPLKEIADRGISSLSFVKSVLVHRRTGVDVPMTAGRDYWLDEELAAADNCCPPEAMDSEDPLFILYTSGSTGKPKGVLHTSAGYLLYTGVTHEYVFDYRKDDVYFCTADIGWVTGHSYIVYGPLFNAATSLMFESVPTYPDAGRYWDIVERHKVNIFYTAPTAIRAIAREGDKYVEAYDRSSLRVLGTVGEPINEDAWKWYYEVVGEGRCAIVDTWWQTETGGILITPLPGATPTKPGSATRPFFGIIPCIVDDHGEELEGNNVKGYLCLKFPWPGQMRTLYRDHDRFVDTYFKRFPGKYFAGDACIRDDDGYYWITGRVDDVLNVAGHRLGTAEIESAIAHSGIVAECAVVGMPHEIKGSGIYAFCVLNDGVEQSQATEKKIKQTVRDSISAIAAPDAIQFVSGLPKTRSGKIMRRILRQIARGELSDFGDITTLADPEVVDQIATGAEQSR